MRKSCGVVVGVRKEGGFYLGLKERGELGMGTGVDGGFGRVCWGAAIRLLMR